MKLSSSARDLLEGYLLRLRGALAGEGDPNEIDVLEIEADVRDHIREALAEHRGSVGIAPMARVLHAMGNPGDWMRHKPGMDASPLPSAAAPCAAPRFEDWNLAYASLALLLLAFALPPFLWIGVFGAFLTARASIDASQSSTIEGAARDRDRQAQAWVRNPALLAIYVPAMMLLLLWPAIALRFAADFVVDHPSLFAQMPIEIEWIADRIAQIRLSNFDPSTTLQHAVRSGHWLIFPVGCWLLVLSAIAAMAPRALGSAFQPFFKRRSRGLAATLALCGCLLVAASIGLALLKLSFAQSSPV